jgi:hypothetical protein
LQVDHSSSSASSPTVAQLKSQFYYQSGIKEGDLYYCELPCSECVDVRLCPHRVRLNNVRLCHQIGSGIVMPGTISADVRALIATNSDVKWLLPILRAVEPIWSVNRLRTLLAQSNAAPVASAAPARPSSSSLLPSSSAGRKRGRPDSESKSDAMSKDQFGSGLCFLRLGPTEETRDFVACDKDDCSVQWFHCECVGLTLEQARHMPWICPHCSGKYQKGMRCKFEKKL